MPMKKKTASKKTASKTSARSVRPQSRSKPRSRNSSETGRKALEALNERLDIMLPEVMYRIAAIEHLLVQKGFCSHEQLSGARQFIQDQEQS